jgi:hypothetical protein
LNAHSAAERVKSGNPGLCCLGESTPASLNTGYGLSAMLPLDGRRDNLQSKFATVVSLRDDYAHRREFLDARLCGSGALLGVRCTPESMLRVAAGSGGYSKWTH